ncbi:hypothetical protein EV424DRAFT_1649848 [Suillus variegatus]|nr:hypothetical protein EV424DRAFT_1649848 [Suillus variegatus]
MSPRPFVKNLTFQSNDLGKEVTIMLAWSPNVEGLYEDVFPIVWKVSKFGKSGRCFYSLAAKFPTYIRALFPGPYLRPTRPSTMIDNINSLGSRLYMYRLAFARVQVESGKVINAVTSININNSEKTILTEANDVYYFSTPQAGTSGILQAQNHTGTIQEIAVGFVNRGDIMPTFVLYFSDVGYVIYS